jgi:hypothetical protein
MKSNSYMTGLAARLAMALIVCALVAPAYAADTPPPCTAKKKTNCTPTPTPDHPKDPTAQ